MRRLRLIPFLWAVLLAGCVEGPVGSEVSGEELAACEALGRRADAACEGEPVDRSDLEHRLGVLAAYEDACMRIALALCRGPGRRVPAMRAGLCLSGRTDALSEPVLDLDREWTASAPMCPCAPSGWCILPFAALDGLSGGRADPERASAFRTRAREARARAEALKARGDAK